ncbi:MAG: YaeQ family protein [Gemmatimonadaceae bacterium]
MALTATIHNFDIQLSDVDRGVYETLSLRVACHPSETEEHLVTRVLAYCLEYADGIAFGKGISDPDEPAITVRDMTGALVAWIEIGSPDAERLHRASKASPRVVVYTHKDGAALARQLSGARIHRAESLELYAVSRPLLDALVARLDRRTKFDVAVTERHLYVTIGDESLDGSVERISIAPNDR